MAPIETKMKETRLGWFGHIRRRPIAPMRASEKLVANEDRLEDDELRVDQRNYRGGY